MSNQQAAEKKHPRQKHGMYKTPEYKVWKGAIDRCCNPKCKHFHLYGGRGISICEKWRHDFAAFIQDVGPRPSREHSLDRYPNNDGNYEPGNVRWATRSEQQRNTRDNVFLTKDGLTLTMVEWSEKLGLKYETIRFRHYRGWPDDEVLQPKIIGRPKSARLRQLPEACNDQDQHPWKTQTTHRSSSSRPRSKSQRPAARSARKGSSTSTAAAIRRGPRNESARGRSRSRSRRK